MKENYKSIKSIKEVPDQLRKLRRQFLRYQQAEIVCSLSHKTLFEIEPYFSEYSYGFRPKRRAQQAAIKLVEYFCLLGQNYSMKCLLICRHSATIMNSRVHMCKSIQ